MRVDVELENGYLPDAYGKYAAEEDKHGWSCRRSFPITVEDIPRDAEALALVFLDWDSVPVCGFPWIHWTAVIRGPFEDTLEIPDDASRKCPCRLVQGYNSAAKSEPARGVGYVGPCPPDADHAYTLKVFALDEEPDLDGPFWANELMRECREHAIDEADAILPSRCQTTQLAAANSLRHAPAPRKRKTGFLARFSNEAAKDTIFSWCTLAPKRA